MKKLFVVSTLLLSATFAFAQNLSFGVRGGLNVANLSGSDLSSSNKHARAQFNLGAYGLYSLNEKMGLQAELFYSGEGARWTSGGATEAGRINFLSLPVFFKYNIVKGLYVMGGPQLSFLLAAHDKLTQGGSSQTTDLSKLMHKVGFGLTPAIGYDLNKFSFSMRYQIGVSNLSDNGGTMRSNVFSIVVGYKVFGGKK